MLTALPPTKGHLHLIQFASELGVPVEVDLCTQPHEPMVTERAMALHRAVAPFRNVQLRHFNQAIEQNPDAPGFWGMWKDMFYGWGFQPGDLIVASEDYGKQLAEVLGGVYVPYDPYREVAPIKATVARHHLWERFDELMPEFQPFVRTRVTIFGAESTGKTTLSKRLSSELGLHYTMEWARPYLETVKNEITDETMTDIWKGQAALQRSARFLTDKPVIVQDTDLYSTLGYWGFWKPEEVPPGLVLESALTRSDLYLITQSNIPFEQDPLRYGGDKREASDQYWIGLCEQYGLNYRVLTHDEPGARLVEAERHIRQNFLEKNRSLIDYTREHNEN